jgi:hypothetical protein
MEKKGMKIITGIGDPEERERDVPVGNFYGDEWVRKVDRGWKVC